MINKLKTLAIAMTAAGATVAATSALAVTDTNTYTNVVQDISINLIVVSNSPVKSSTSITGGKPVTVTTKSIITALSNASGSIPTLVGFDWGRAPQLVYLTTFSHTNVVSNTVTPIFTNIMVTILPASNVFAFQSNTNTYPTNGTAVTISSTNGTATVTNNGGTNVLSVSGWAATTNFITTNVIAYVTNTSGNTNVSASFPTNVGVWTVFTATATSNLTAITYTNVPHTTVDYITNSTGIEVQGGTPTAPVFADVSDYLYSGERGDVTVQATGTGLGTTNALYKTETFDELATYDIKIFNTNASTGAGNNLDLRMQGFLKGMYKFDVLHQVRGLTNQVSDTTSSANVAGYGDIGGSYVTNSVGASNSISLFATEGLGTNGSVTNAITGSITNPIPVVFEGTVTIGAPKNIAQ